MVVLEEVLSDTAADIVFSAGAIAGKSDWQYTTSFSGRSFAGVSFRVAIVADTLLRLDQFRTLLSAVGAVFHDGSLSSPRAMTAKLATSTPIIPYAYFTIRTCKQKIDEDRLEFIVF